MSTSTSTSTGVSSSSVERYLRHTFYTDVLMPAVHKRPMYPHKNSQWSWSQYDSFNRSNRSFQSSASC